MGSRRRRLDPNVVVLGRTAFLQDLSSEMIFPFLPAFLTAGLGAAPLVLGLMEGAADAVSSLLRPLFGALSDRSARRRPYVVAGYALADAVRPLLALVTAPWQVLAIRLFDRFGKAVRTAPRDALLAAASERGGRGRAFGYHRAMDHAGAVVGPLLAAVLFVALDRSYRGLFLVASLPGVLAVLYAWGRVRESVAVPPVQVVEPDASDPDPVGADPPRDRRLPGLLAAIFLFTLGNSSDAFLLLRLQEAGVDVAWLPALWAGLHVVKSASAYPLGALSDRVGRRPMLLAGWGYYAVVYLGFAVAGSATAVVGIFLAYGLFHGLTEGAERALVGDLASPARRGVAFGAYEAVVGIAALPASLIMGIVWQTWGSPVGFGIGAALAGFAACLLVVLPLERP